MHILFPSPLKHSSYHAHPLIYNLKVCTLLPENKYGFGVIHKINSDYPYFPNTTELFIFIMEVYCVFY